MTKHELRRTARTRRVDRASADRAQDALLREDALRTAGVVALYASTEHEPPLERVARELLSRDATVVFPRVDGPSLRLHVAAPDALVPGYGGILEPRADAVEIDAARVDVFVVPGVLFDREGRRLGRGKGHYDRLLKRARSDSLRLGFAFDERIVEQLPEEEWDVRMHWVVTATKKHRGAS